jgi:hypothetical protein
VSHFSGFDSSVEFDVGTLLLGLVTFNYDLLINDKVTNYFRRCRNAELRKIDFAENTEISLLNTGRIFAEPEISSL